MRTPENTYTVTQVTGYLKQLIQTDPVLGYLRVRGEVSNVTYHSSGHLYFSLKDPQSQLSCVMWRSQVQRADRIETGDQIEAWGRLDIYPPRGSYQLVVDGLKKDREEGALYQRFVALKAKLEREGLFAQARKRPLPAYPETLAVVTSPTGAAIRDVLRTLRRRYDRGQVLVIPTLVQGAGAADAIVQSLQAAAAAAVDVILLVRGGGSMEDLWSFNEESVARAIVDSPVPVVSGIGHETDFTIADFVADLRASTPTAAAEQVVPDLSAVRSQLNDYTRQFRRELQRYIEFKRQVVDDYEGRLHQAWKQALQQRRHELDMLETQLRGMDITRLLERGYSLTLREGRILRDSRDLRRGDEIETVFARGRIASVVSREDPEGQPPFAS
ncbi:MAG: exodeoxyribonuclease VII large subunit [Bacteroidetes bacterium]|nr:MAG: exodeoxyribonuclease VII large subunit [Bacteroidota bacterium]